MPASVLAQILLRIYALNQAVVAVIQIASGLISPAFPDAIFQIFVVPLVTIVLAVIIWQISPWLCRLAAGKEDTEVSIENLRLYHLYSTVLLALGAYLAMTNFAAVFNWIHYFAVERSQGGEFLQEADSNFYHFTEPLLTMLAGLALLFTARIWARKLTQNNDGSGNSSSTLS